MLAARVSAQLARWGIEADDSAGRPLSQTAAGTLLLGIVAAAAEDLAPVPLLALLKHPLVGGEGDARLAWLEAVRALDLALRGPRPAAGLHGPRCPFRGEWCLAASSRRGRALGRNVALAAAVDPVRGTTGAGRGNSLPAMRLGAGKDGRMTAELVAEFRRCPSYVADRHRRGCGAVAAPVAGRAAGAAAFWRASAHLHLGPARSPAAAGRPDGARRA